MKIYLLNSNNDKIMIFRMQKKTCETSEKDYVNIFLENSQLEHITK